MKYLVTATLQVEYQIPIEAPNEESAIGILDLFFDEDFKPFQTNAVWSFEAKENE